MENNFNQHFIGYLDDFDMPSCSPGTFVVMIIFQSHKLSLFNFQTLFTLHLDETYQICVPKQDYNHLFVVSTFLLFVIPMSIITILYILIGLQLRKSKIVQRGAVNGSSVRLKVKFLCLSKNIAFNTIDFVRRRRKH